MGTTAASSLLGNDVPSFAHLDLGDNLLVLVPSIQRITFLTVLKVLFDTFQVDSYFSFIEDMLLTGHCPEARFGQSTVASSILKRWQPSWTLGNL